jgi:hypothetical protein
MTRGPWGRLTIRSALFLGFGLTLGVWLFAGYQFTQRVAEIERQAEGVNTRYMRAQELLSSVRTQLGIALLATVYAGRLEDRLRRQQEIDAKSAPGRGTRLTIALPALVGAASDVQEQIFHG